MTDRLNPLRRADFRATATVVVRALLAAASGVLLLGGCLSVPVRADGRFGSGVFRSAAGAANADASASRTAAVSSGSASAALSDRQRRIVAAADEFIGSASFVVDGYRYNEDCTGTILAIYAMAGLHLVDLFPRYQGNGVQRLYAMAEEQDLLYHSEYPQVGDLIFWDNTYDRNGDGKWNDTLTHAGLVLAVEPGGAIEYVHHDYAQGVVRARMNLVDPRTHTSPTGVLVNSPMRMRSHRYLNPDVWLASHLYRRLGALHRIEL